MRSGLRIARAMPCGPRTCPRLPQAKSGRISSCSPAARRRTMAGGSTVVGSDRYTRRRPLRAPCLYIVMELVDGKPLNELIPRKGMRLTEALRIAAQVADALTAAHAASIVHRDLKPANIMVDAHGRTKVLDFGSAKLSAPAAAAGADEATHSLAVEQPVSEEGVILGTVPYMSPEQVEGKPVDARSDIFSFGAVLYEMITGQRAFRGESKISTLSAILKEEPEPVSSVRKEIPHELERIITQCLRKDPERRFQHMDDVRVALEQLK